MLCGLAETAAREVHVGVCPDVLLLYTVLAWCSAIRLASARNRLGKVQLGLSVDDKILAWFYVGKVQMLTAGIGVTWAAVEFSTLIDNRLYFHDVYTMILAKLIHIAAMLHPSDSESHLDSALLVTFSSPTTICASNNQNYAGLNHGAKEHSRTSCEQSSPSSCKRRTRRPFSPLRSSTLMLVDVGSMLLIVAADRDLRNGAGAHIGQAFGALDVDGTDLGVIAVEDSGDFFEGWATIVDKSVLGVLTHM